MRFAVIADPHFHDVDFADAGGAPFLRTLVDTAASTRVFNESAPAFRAALDHIAAEGITTVIIVGDLTDDGQAYAVAGVVALLDDYSARFGMRFFMTPGNHDLFARTGRHQTKRILRADGRFDLVSSDPTAQRNDAVDLVVTPAMFAGGYDTVIPALGHLGFMRHSQDLHWESPFGTEDALDTRLYDVSSADGSQAARMVDASYLVEPVTGLWLLSLDANVYRPSGDKFVDCSEAGWNAALVHKPYLLDWTADVVSRARQLGKQLIVFSHYPVVDPLDATEADERALLGETTFMRRMPKRVVSEAFRSAGVELHFSGHWHVNDTAHFADANGHLFNIAVPAPVAFPPAFKLCELTENALAVDTRLLRDVAGYDVGFERYSAECAVRGYDDEGLGSTAEHFEFIARHLDLLVRDRYLPREWPAELRAAVEHVTIGDIARRLTGTVPQAVASLSEMPFLAVIVDWYKLRKASDLALIDLDPIRQHAYAELVALCAGTAWPTGSIEAQLALFFKLLGHHSTGLPSTRFSIAFKSGAVVAA